jgi:hypothetical protein
MDRTAEDSHPVLTSLALALALAMVACGGGGGGQEGGRGVGGTPPPSLTGISPTSCPVGGGSALTLTGTGFHAGATVSFGGVAGTVVSVASTTAITATCPAHAPGAVEVTVAVPGAQAATLASTFTYVAPPTLVSVLPASGSTDGGEQVDLAGTSFEVGTAPVVTFGATPAIVATGFTATSITVISPTHGPGAVDVTVTNGDGQASTLVNGFTYRTPAANAPTVVGVRNDATGLPSGGVSGGDAVTIAGTHFAPGATVLFGAAPATNVAYVSTTTLTATTPLDQPAGTVDVTVALPGTGLVGTALRGFTFLLPAPHVVAFSVRGSPPAGGGLLTLKGQGLLASSTVTFGGVPATVTDFTSNFPLAGARLTVIVPPSPLPPGVTDGFTSVVLWNPDGQSSTLGSSISPDGTSWPANFHYGPPPVVTGFSPPGGHGPDLTLAGDGFSSDAAGARIGLQVVLTGPSFAILQVRKCPDDADPACLAGVVSPSPTSLVATIPSDQLVPGSYAVVLTNFDGQASTAPGAFVVP